MQRLQTILVATLGACATEPMPAPQTPATAQWDAGAAQEVQAEFARMFGMWEALDLEALKGELVEDGFLTSYDFDMDGKPMKMGSRDEAVRYMEAMIGPIKKSGGSFKIKQHSLECRATATLGYCAANFDLVATMADGTKMTQPTQVTGTMRKRDDGWKWTHWHSSLAQMPSPPTPAPPPAPALAAVEHDTRSLKLADVPNMGVKGALLWQNQASGGSATITQFPKGAQFPAHLHTHGLHIYVIKGTFTWTEQNGTVHNVKAGGYTYEPGKHVHTTSSKDGCTFLQFNEGTFDLVPVDDKGQPQPAMVPVWPAPQK